VTYCPAQHERMHRRYQEAIEAYLLEHPCVDCGESDTVVLQFDHVRGVRRESVPSMSSHRWALVIEEIAKCEVRCANCHVRKTKRNKEHAGWRKRKPESMPLLEWGGVA